jgi:glycosyltransferase involved in cell wall biosynthesis
MRVAMLAEFPLPGELPVGGPQVAVARLVPELARRGIDVVVVAPDPRRSTETTAELDSGATLVTVPTGDRLLLARGLRPWRRRAKEVVERMGIDLIHAQNPLVGGIAAADIDGPPRVVTVRGNPAADTRALYTGAPGAVRVALRERLARIAVRRADVVVSVNPDWRINLSERPERFLYIPNIVEEDFFGRARRDSEPGGILFAGGDNPIKGWPLVAAAWPRIREAVPNARLDVIGWKNTAAPPTIDGDPASLTVAGWLSSADLADRMSRASALVIASTYEVSPIVLAEAWAVGLPVVATRVGGIPALATGAAVLVERDAAAIADGLIRTLTGGEEIEQAAEEGSRRATQHRADAVAGAHIALYEDLVGLT